MTLEISYRTPEKSSNLMIAPPVETNPLPKQGHPLENQTTADRLDKVRNWFAQAQSVQYHNRADMARDERFYDGEQWEVNDKLELEARGQAALVFNKIKPTINWILGTERKSRVDTMVLARSKEKTGSAEKKTKLLKYVDDVNMTAYERSLAFKDATVAGLGWIEIGMKRDAEDEPLFVRRESWRNMWYDHLAVDLGLKDARYVFRAKWLDLDVAIALYPDRKMELEQEAQNVLRLHPYGTEDTGIRSVGEYDETTGRTVYPEGGPFIEDNFSIGSSRLRVRIIECWHREVGQVNVCHCPGSPIHGSIMHPADNHQKYAVENNTACVKVAVKPHMRLLIYCGATALYDQATPYRHNRFPFIPIWCYRRAHDNAPYGAVRDIIDPQMDMNKRKSKALHILNSNKFIADDNATDNWDDFRDEANRPDGIMKKTPNSSVIPLVETEVAKEQLQEATNDERFIQEVSGVTDENLGRDTKLESGIAIGKKQNQGLVATSVVFDNLNMAVQMEGEIKLSLVEQFYDQAKVIRLLNDKKASSFVSINDEEGNITDDKCDFVVAQQDHRDTIRQSMFEMMTEFTTRLDPSVSLNILDLVIDMSDLPGRQTLVDRIRKLNGQTDPDAATTPEMEQENKQKEAQTSAEEQRNKEFETKMQELELKIKDSEAALNAAKLDKLKAEAVVSSVEALFASMQAAQVAATTPGTVPIADEIAKSAGFVDKNQAPIFQEPITGTLNSPVEAGSPIGPASAMPQNTSPMYPARPIDAGKGMMAGIESGE